ncbi:hypothetical protein FACS1894162_0350 [Bacteroidia bacterium]|nr:hypothetical protein FACS1894162_0350 [Bacteroidia bacterium]
MSYEELIKIKADLLCEGLKKNEAAEEIKKRQNPFDDPKTGNEGIFIMLDNGEHKIDVLVSVSHVFDQVSKYEIRKNTNNDYELLKNNQLLDCCVSIFDVPKWYDKNNKTTTGKEMSKFFLHEGGRFLHQSYSGCEFHKINQGCKFCSTKFPRMIATPDEVAETVILACKENPQYQVALGGGYTNDEQTYFEYFFQCVQKIRTGNKNVPIWIEMIPPTEQQIETLINAGATSFGFNIEIWDDKVRQEICPGKSEQRTKTQYIERMKFALEHLGDDKVGSVLIAGLESKESTKEGIDILTEIGVHLCILPFKPWNEAALKDKEHCSSELFYELSAYAALKVSENKLNLQSNQGCFLCDCCTLIHDINQLNN